MPNKLTAEARVALDATPQRVWQALTDPADIKQYLFGTEAVSDWQKGSKITFTGVWEGKPYTDKGTIVDMEPNKLLHTTYYSPMSGKPDLPENYAHVNYDISTEDGKTVLSITQDNIENGEEVEKMKNNWAMVLDSLKKMIEKK